VERTAVHFAEYHRGGNGEFAASAEDAHGDFAAIGDEDFSEHA
jgi:hypothetical protein